MDGVAYYELDAERHKYKLEVDSSSILPEWEIGSLIHHASTTETYISLKCTEKATLNETEFTHSGLILADAMLEKNGLLRD